MDYDKILAHFGELSRWNLINLALLWLPPIMGGIIVLQTSFSGLSVCLSVWRNAAAKWRKFSK